MNTYAARDAKRTNRRALDPGILTLLGIAEFMLVLDVSIVNVALPAIRADLGFGSSSLEWVVNAYALTFGGFLLLGGRAADLFGGRPVFLAALGVFTVASLACGLAGDRTTLVAARAIQGLSAGVLSPATLSILTETYRGPDERTRALSVWTAVAIGGGAVGSVLGGALTSGLSWRWIFFVNVPVGVSLLVLGRSALPGPAERTPAHHLDLAGAVTVTGGLVALVWALIRAHADGWGSIAVIAPLALAVVLLSAFAVLEAHLVRDPLIPFGVFRSRLLAAGNALSFLSFLPVLPTWFFLTVYLQTVRGQTAIQAGLVFLPMSLAVIGGSQLSFRVIARVDARALIVAGGLTAAAGMAWLASLSLGTALAAVVAPACLTMFGGGLMFAPITIACTADAAPGQGGLASGLMNTTRQVGGALGLAVLGTIAAAGSHPGGGSDAAAISDGIGNALAVGAGVFVVTAALGALLLPGRLGPAGQGRS